MSMNVADVRAFETPSCESGLEPMDHSPPAAAPKHDAKGPDPSVRVLPEEVALCPKHLCKFRPDGFWEIVHRSSNGPGVFVKDLGVCRVDGNDLDSQTHLFEGEDLVEYECLRQTRKPFHDICNTLPFGAVGVPWSLDTFRRKPF